MVSSFGVIIGRKRKSVCIATKINILWCLHRQIAMTSACSSLQYWDITMDWLVMVFAIYVITGYKGYLAKEITTMLSMPTAGM